MNYHVSTAALLLAAFVNGCGTRAEKAIPRAVRSVLEHADTLEFLTLNPSPPENPASVADTLAGYEILGRVTITDPTLRERLMGGLYAAVNGSDGSVMSCFNPRHALRATRGETVVSVIICFECRSLALDAGRTRTILTIRPDEEVIFNEVAKALKLPSPPAKGNATATE
jgi:hypothetical protein